MKKLSFLALAAAGLLLGACSTNDVTDASSINQRKGDQYISLDINLPSVSSLATRNTTVTNDNNYGDGNFELNDGLEGEYKVNKAYLVVFAKNSDENKATFRAAFELATEPWTKPSDKQVTETSRRIVQKVGANVAPGDLALVVLNPNNIFELSTDGTFKYNGTTAAVGTTTYGDIQKSLVTYGTDAVTNKALPMTAAGFFMANAPLTDKQGSLATPLTGAKVRTLVEIANVWPTESEALSAPDTDVASIYVERGVAKVTLRAMTSMNLGTQYTKGGTPADLPVVFQEWTIDQSNTKSFTVRSTEGHDDFIKLASNGTSPVKYRYAGQSDITEGQPGDYKYRTYFAKDPNYDGTSFSAPKMHNDELAKLTAYSSLVGDENPQYCFENTFDVDRQNVQNTTLLRLKVKVGSDDLYIVNNNKSTIYKLADVQTEAANAAVTAVEAAKAAGTITVSGTISSSDFNVTITPDATTGTAAVTAVTFKDATHVSTADQAKVDVLKAAKDAIYDISYYKDGMSYYTIRIKHFGDQLTPWHSTETPIASLTDGIYPATNKDANYLGRYGVLRNNWYDIEVGSIKYLGEAVPKDFSTDPTTDDELDGYIAVKIHILSWAKRTQKWNL